MASAAWSHGRRSLILFFAVSPSANSLTAVSKNAFASPGKEAGVGLPKRLSYSLRRRSVAYVGNHSKMHFMYDWESFPNLLW